MSAPRALGFVVLAAVTGCAPLGGTATTRPMIKHEDGPKGYIHAQYSGGLVMRTVNVSFRVEESAYVIIGHLGGDGVIRVLYPESPESDEGLLSPVRAKKTVHTSPFFASYDGAPSLYTFRMNPFRGLAAMHDSYDGRGHGYVFMITTRAPMRYELITADDVEWDEIPVRNYDLLADPRLAVRDFAETLARGRYTLKFANSFTTQPLASYAMNAWDCSLLSGFGYTHLIGFWGSWGMASFWPYGYHRGFYSSGCDRLYFALGNYYGGRFRDYGYVPQQFVPVAGPAPAPQPVTPVANRPTYRPFGPRAEPSGQSSLNRSIPTTRRPSQPSSWPTSEGVRSSPRSGPTYGRRADAPRTTQRTRETQPSYTPRSDGPRSVSSDGSPRSTASPSTRTSSPAPQASSPAPSRTSSSKPTPPPQQ